MSLATGSHIIHLPSSIIYNEEVSLIHGGSVVQPGAAYADGMCAEGLRVADLQGEALGVRHRVAATCR